MFTASLHYGRRYAHHIGPMTLEGIAAEVVKLAGRQPGQVIRAKLAIPATLGGLPVPAGEFTYRPAGR